MSWCTSACLQIDDTNDEAAKKAAKDTRSVLNLAIPFVANSFSYPLSVVSTVMAVGGSGFAVLVNLSPTAFIF